MQSQVMDRRLVLVKRVISKDPPDLVASVTNRVLERSEERRYNY